MSPAIGSASASSLSGLDVSARRAATAASNIANVRSLSPQNTDDVAGFRPLELQQISDDRAEIRAADVRALQTYEPNNPDADADGIVSRANIDLGLEFSELIIAQRSFEANIAALKAADEMLGDLFDAKA